jgi:uridine kinase
MKHKIVLIIVCGGTGSGKTTVANEIKTILPKRISSQIICMDRFYKEHNCKDGNLYLKHNFDHPNAFDWKLMFNSLKSLLANKATKLPIYSYQKSKRENEKELVKPTDVIILEGILALYDADIRALADIKIFVDTPDDERFIRRLIRDKKERNRSDDDIVGQ